MITPQQRNAWRGAYLRELKNIANSEVNPWMDEIEWEDLLEDRLTLFIYRDYLVFLKIVAFVFENHPLVVAALDDTIIKDEDTCTLSQLYLFLRTITPYGQFSVVSTIDCSDDIKQELMLALKEGDEDRFIALSKQIDLKQLCKGIGYVSSISHVLAYQIKMMEHTEPTEEEEARTEETVADINNRSLGNKTIEDNTNEQLSFVQQNSRLGLTMLPSEVEFLQDEYYAVACQWATFSLIVDSCFLPKEFSIIESALRKWSFTDISKDLAHLASLINQDYHYQRIVLPL